MNSPKEHPKTKFKKQIHTPEPLPDGPLRVYASVGGGVHACPKHHGCRIVWLEILAFGEYSCVDESDWRYRLGVSETSD
jgi:hypothetical protein